MPSIFYVLTYPWKEDGGVNIQCTWDCTPVVSIGGAGWGITAAETSLLETKLLRLTAST